MNFYFGYVYIDYPKPASLKIGKEQATYPGQASLSIYLGISFMPSKRLHKVGEKEWCAVWQNPSGRGFVRKLSSEVDFIW